MNEQIQNLLLDLLYAVIVVCLPIVSRFVVQYLQSLKGNVDKNKELTHYNATLEKALDIVSSVVIMVNQTEVDTLKKEGKFTKEAQQKAFNDAVTNVDKLMTQEMKEFINVAYGDFSVWLKNAIEKAVAENKPLNWTTLK